MTRIAQSVPVMSDSEVRCWMPPRDESGMGSLRTEKGNLPLKGVDVRAEITGLSARVILKQTFVNAHASPLEATYVFPMPDRAAVVKFTVTVAGKIIEGVLKERGEARRDYDVAIQAGHRAAIAEEDRPGTFTMRVGNLMPGEEATVHLEMTAPLAFADGEATFRFPLVVAPRYIPGAPLGGEDVGSGTVPDTDAVPDASRITPPVLLPGFPNPVRLAIEVDVDPAGLKLGGIRSSLHAITEELRREGNLTRIRVQPGERLDRDFILRLALGEEQIGSSLVTRADATGNQGTFLLTLVPPTGVAGADRPRDAVFVIDRSGSMEGWKMVAARRAIARMVDTLGPKDRFSVYAFDDGIESPGDFNGQELVEATDRNRFRAVEFLAKVESRGGTEMAQPLDRAVTVLAADARDGVDRIVVLVTDGQVGNEDQILRALGSRVAGMRIFTVGIDTAVNEGFLKRLAAMGGGACELVESEDRLDQVMDRIHRRIGTPVLTDFVLEAAGMEIDRTTLTPAKLPALFAGAPLTIGGRYVGTPKGGISVKAIDAAGSVWNRTMTATTSANPAIGAQWARARLRELEDRYAITGGDAALEKRIVETSLAFGVLCRFTAFIAVDRTEVVNQGGKNVKVTQAVDAPKGWDMFAEGAAEDGEVYESAKDRSATVVARRSAPAPTGRASNSTKAGGVSRGPAMSPPRAQMPEPEAEANAPAEAKVVAAGPMQKPKPVSKSAAPSPPPPARAKSSWNPLAGLKQKKEAPEKTGAKQAESDAREEQKKDPSLDLAPYRRRAREILALLEGKTLDDDALLAVLRTVSVKMSALLEDLTSVGVPESEIGSLLKVEFALRVAVADASTARRALTLRKQLEDELRAFGGTNGGGAPAPRPGARAGGFWK